MLDASQATVVAYYNGNGEIIHESHLPDDVIEAAEFAAIEAKAPTGTGWRVFDQAIEDAGYTPLIRYNIHEYESERAYDIEAYPDDWSDDLTDLIKRRDALDAVIDLYREHGDAEDETTRYYIGEHVGVIEDWHYDINAEIEALINDLAAVMCDECGERIE